MGSIASVRRKSYYSEPCAGAPKGEEPSIEAYLERPVQANQDAARELETLALEGLHSGSPIEAGPSHWQEKHRLLDERLSNTNRRIE